MTTDPMAQALHQKSIGGGALTPEEQERLSQWYATSDAEEAKMLEQGWQSRLRLLQNRIDDVTAKIVDEARKIQTLECENERIRQEIARLEGLLAQQHNRQSA